MPTKRIRPLMLGGLVLVALAANSTPGLADEGAIVVKPGDAGGQYAPPSIDMSATSPGSLANGSHAGGIGSAGGSHGGQGTPSGGSGGGQAPACTYTPTGISPQQLVSQFGDYQAGPSTGSGSIGYNVTCNGVQIGWVLGDPSRPGNASGPGPALPTPGELAGQAYTQLKLPPPVAHHSPDIRLADGRSATIVDERTWIWTDRDAWVPQRKRIQTGSVWAEVTATPIGLAVSSDLGVSTACTGPGTPYTRSSGVHAASPDCGEVFPHSSYGLPGDQATITYSIRWHVTWIGSTGADSQSGTLPDLTSRATENLAVVEIQALRSQ